MSVPPILNLQIRLPLDRFELAVDFRTTAQVTGIFGPSGGGKTSLLECVAGLRRDAVGRVEHGGDTWLDSARRISRPPESRFLGYVPQDGLLFPHLDVRANLLAGAGRAHARGQDVGEMLATVARLLELEPLLARPVGSLSGGERQRVALGRALCSGPKLLLLDEPLASLDLPLRRRVLPFLRRVRQELDLPMLFVSHDPAEVRALCDEVIVLRQGKVIARGAPAAVLTDPEILPLAGDSFENLFPGTLLGTEGSTSTLRLGAGSDAPLLLTPAVPAAIGAEVLISVPAREVLVATEEPRGLSARNVLRARILAVSALDGMRLVTASLGQGAPALGAELTPEACEKLKLVPGLEVFLVLKTVGCVVFPSGADGPTG